MDYCNGGDVKQLKLAKGRLSEAEAKYLISQIVEGIIALAQLGVVHRDIKAANILLHFPKKKGLQNCNSNEIIQF